jgi:hypothetical protein
MFLEKIRQKLIKIDLISYYLKDDVYYVLKQRLEDSNLINNQKHEFSKSDFINYINLSLTDNSFTYISTCMDTANQGIVSNCSNNHYKELGIDINSVKTLCINNEFSIFVGMYDFNNLKKENEIFQYDHLYSPYSLIHSYGIQNNTAYLLTFEDYIVLMITHEKPVYGNIYYFKDNIIDDSDSQIDLDLVDDISMLDDIEDLSDSLEDSIEDAADLIDDDNDVSLEDSVDTLKNETETIEFLKISFKDYYENYSSDFIDKIIILNNHTISDTITTSIEKEFFIDVKLEEFDILKGMNLLAKEDIDV